MFLYFKFASSEKDFEEYWPSLKLGMFIFKHSNLGLWPKASKSEFRSCVIYPVLRILSNFTPILYSLARCGTICGLGAQIVFLLMSLMEPFMPGVSRQIREQLNVPKPIFSKQLVPFLSVGHQLGKVWLFRTFHSGILFFMPDHSIFFSFSVYFRLVHCSKSWSLNSLKAFERNMLDNSNPLRQVRQRRSKKW